MAAKKKTSRKRELPPSATEEGRFSILMEQMQEHNRATIEAVQSSAQQLHRRMDETDERNERRFAGIEAAVRLNSEILRSHSDDIRSLKVSLGELRADVRELRDEVREVRDEVRGLTRRVERIEELLALKADRTQADDLEARVRRIEERLGLSPL